MLGIGEFSKLIQKTIRMLRYYDEAGLLKDCGDDYTECKAHIKAEKEKMTG